MKHVETGAGAERILWLHGGNVAGWMWAPQVPAFDDYVCLVPDLPGFGASADDAWVSIAETADRVADLLDGAPAHVVGLSLGASIAVDLAARHPELVQSLVLASAQITPPRWRDRVAARALLLFWNQRGFWVGLARSYGLTGEDADLFVSTGLGIRRETAVAIYREVRRGVPSASLDAVQTGTLALAGDRDSPAIWRASLARLRAAGAEVAVAPGLHHQFSVEDPVLFNDAVRSWIESRRLGAGLVTPT